MYEIFEKLLKENGLRASDVAKGTGLTSTFFTEWKKGKAKNPNPKNLKKVADFFGVTMDYLMTGEEKENKNEDPYYLNDETAKMAQDIFENKELRMLFDTARDAEPEDLKAVHNMLLALKRKERGNIDN